MFAGKNQARRTQETILPINGSFLRRFLHFLFILSISGFSPLYSETRTSGGLSGDEATTAAERTSVTVMSGGEEGVQTEVYLSKQPGLGHTPYSAIPPPELTRVNSLMWGD